ncbi:MAG: exonuclease SbcCD subunit D, partial [Thermomicrobiales bacterium]
MRTLRIAHLSDTHLGYRSLAKHDPVSGRNQRSIDIERAFAWAIDDILARDIDLVIHSGDLFHHSRPVFPAIGAAIRQLRKLERKDIPVVLIAGNHDTPRLRMTGSVYSLLESALPDVRFFGGYDDHQFALEQLDVVLTVTPHGRLTNPEPASVFPVRDRRNVLVTHGLVPHMDLPYSLREPGEEEISEFMLDQAFDYIALGHYHQHGQPRPNAWYAGSTERIGWGDVETEPGYLIVELGSVGSAPAVERVQVPIARPMH